MPLPAWRLRSRSIGRGLDPRNISGLSVWYDAADASTITLNGSAVSQWNDKSGNGLHASQSTANNQPAYLTNDRNGLATVSFDGSNDSLVTSSFADGWTAFTSFAVIANVGIGGGGIGLGVFWTRSTDRQRSIVIVATNNTPPVSIRGHLLQSSVNDYDCAAFGSNNTYYYMTNQWDGTTSERSTAFTARTSGTARTNTTSGALTSSNVANTVLRLGNRSDGTRGYNGKIGELIVYSSSLSTAARDAVEEYLKTKWGF